MQYAPMSRARYANQHVVMAQGESDVQLPPFMRFARRMKSQCLPATVRIIPCVKGSVWQALGLLKIQQQFHSGGRIASTGRRVIMDRLRALFRHSTENPRIHQAD